MTPQPIVRSDRRQEGPIHFHVNYEVFPSGKEFVMLKRINTGDTVSARMIGLLNGTRELARRAPLK